MIDYLKKQGFLYTENDDLNNREFTTVSNNIALDEENTTMDNASYVDEQSYLVFLDSKSFSSTVMIDKLDAIILDTRNDNKMVSGQVANIEKVENGYNITIDFTIKDL